MQPAMGLVADPAEQVRHTGVGQCLGSQAGFDHAGDIQRHDTESVVLPDEFPANLVVGVVPETCYATLASHQPRLPSVRRSLARCQRRSFRRALSSALGFW